MTRIILVTIVALNICLQPFFSTAKAQSAQERKLQQDGYVSIQSVNSTIVIDLKYASTDNFTNVLLYDSIRTAYLHPVAAAKLAKAQQLLKNTHPSYSLIVYDAARPLSVQRKMFAVVKGTAQEPYVANPTRTGLHNYGMAVDLSICDNNGKALDMGTIFDHLGLAAQINNEDQLVKDGVLTQQNVRNRQLLRTVMVGAGFQTIRGEWWHFNAVSLTVAKQLYKVIP